MITYRTGNVLDADDIDVVLHGVNCSGGFGSGIAGEIARRYPNVRENYLSRHNSGVPWTLGETQAQFVSKAVMIGDDKYSQIVVNCATQQRYGNVFEGPYVSYTAVRQIIRKTLITYGPKMRIGMPKIGAGLGGGNWDIIEEIINQESGDREIFVYCLDRAVVQPK